jgi:hypothetical protein
MNASNTRETETIGMPATTGQLITAKKYTAGTRNRRDTNNSRDGSNSRETSSSREPCTKPGRQAEQQRRSIANVTSNMDVRFSRDAVNTASKSRKGSLDFLRSMAPATPGTIACRKRRGGVEPEGALPIFGLRLLAYI